MELKSIKCPNCGSSQIINDVCKHCGSILTKPKEEISKTLDLTISGMNNVVIIKKGKNKLSSFDVSGMNQSEELECESIILTVSGMNQIVKIDKDIEILEKSVSGMSNKIIRI